MNTIITPPRIKPVSLTGRTPPKLFRKQCRRLNNNNLKRPRENVNVNVDGNARSNDDDDNERDNKKPKMTVELSIPQLNCDSIRFIAKTIPEDGYTDSIIEFINGSPNHVRPIKPRWIFDETLLKTVSLPPGRKYGGGDSCAKSQHLNHTDNDDNIRVILRRMGDEYIFIVNRHISLARLLRLIDMVLGICLVAYTGWTKCLLRGDSWLRQHDPSQSLGAILLSEQRLGHCSSPFPIKMDQTRCEYDRMPTLYFNYTPWSRMHIIPMRMVDNSEECGVQCERDILALRDAYVDRLRYQLKVDFKMEEVMTSQYMLLLFMEYNDRVRVISNQLLQLQQQQYHPIFDLPREILTYIFDICLKLVDNYFDIFTC